MKIKILKSAKNDLREGFYFYESQQAGLGTYFLETLSSDIESLKLFAGIHSTVGRVRLTFQTRIKYDGGTYGYKNTRYSRTER